MCLWSGLMKIVQETTMINKINKFLIVSTVCILFFLQACQPFQCRVKELARHSDLGESHSAAFTFRSVHALDGRFTFIPHDFYPMFILLGWGGNKLITSSYYLFILPVCRELWWYGKSVKERCD